MSDYVRGSSTFFGDKDALASGTAAKIVKGSEFDTEFNAIATAVATKYDSADRGAASGIAPLDGSSEVPAANLNIASAGEATARTGDFLISAGVFDSAWDAAAGENAGAVLDIQALTDPAADRILFWDDSDDAVEWLTATGGVGITDNDLTLDFASLTALSGTDVAGADLLVVYDDSATAFKKISYQSHGVPIITDTTTSYTPASADVNSYVECDNAAAISFNINTGVGEKGNFFIIEQKGAGQVTVGGTATLRSAGSALKTGTQYSVIVALCTATNTWTVYGDVAA
jgi:hypothetical protein